MAAERFVVLGLGTARCAWFSEVARWATVGSIPVEFVKCISADELQVRLTSGRPFSALLVDAASGAIDRDLIDTATRHRVTVMVVDGAGDGPWLALGAASVLSPQLRREHLLEALVEHSRVIGSAAELPMDGLPSAVTDQTAGGVLIGVTGNGGTGASSVAMAMAQGLAQADTTRSVVLADLCLDGDQAMLHDARDIVPGLQELVDAHRSAHPRPAEVQALTFDVVNRGYRLLLGLRRHRDWAVLKPRTFAAALDGLRGAFDIVVADVDPDMEGEAECGAIQVEERNVMARTVLGTADVVLIVGVPGVKGIHALVRTITRLRDQGVAPERMITVVNQSSRSTRGRAELTRAVADLSGDEGRAAVGTIHLTDRRGFDEILRDGARMPDALTSPLAGAVGPLLERLGPRDLAAGDLTPVPVVPGRLGAWAEDEVAG